MGQMGFLRQILIGTTAMKDLVHLILMIGIGHLTAVGQLTKTVVAGDHPYLATQEFQSRNVKIGAK